MNYETLLVKKTDGLLRITLNRPEQLNALNPTAMAELRQLTDQARHDASVRAVLLTGSGRGFCAGADLTEVNLSMDADKRRAQGEQSEQMMIDFLNPIAANLALMNKPVVAAINGVAAGGGMGLALAADLIFAAESAYFVQVFVPQLGIVPDTGSTWTLPRLIGRGRAMGAMLTGERISASQAENWGMIWKCVKDEELAETAEKTAVQLAAGPTFGIGLTKQALAASEQNNFTEQLAKEAKLVNLGCGSADFVAGTNAFLNKQAPRFSGLEDGE